MNLMSKWMFHRLRILPVTWLLFLGYEFILSEANLLYEAKPSAINLPNLNINSYPKNMSPCNDFITYFFVDEMDIFTRLSRASIATYAIRLFTAWVINQSERGKSIKYVIRVLIHIFFRLHTNPSFFLIQQCTN